MPKELKQPPQRRFFVGEIFISMKRKKLILIVCWGNIYRSPVAQIFLKREIAQRKLENEIICESRGIQGTFGFPAPRHPNFTFYEEEFAAAQSVLRKYDIDLSKCHFQPVNKAAIIRADIILTADDKTHKVLLSHFPEIKNKTMLLIDLVDKGQKIEDPDGLTDTKKYAIITQQLWTSTTLGLSKLLALLMIK